MNKTLLIVIIVVAALALGIGGGYAVSKALPAPLAQYNQEGDPTSGNLPGTSPQVTPNPDDLDDDEAEDGIPLPRLDPRLFNGDTACDVLKKCNGRSGMHGWMEKGFIPPGLLKKNSDWPQEWRYWGPEGMGPWGDDLEETDTGMGAFQLIIQPVSGNVRFESGAGMMWNTKYGRRAMMDVEIPENTLTMEAAAAQAQQALKEESADLSIDPAGVAFHGYYTYEYQVDGKTAGLISVNAEDGDYWFHNWLGNFISREDVPE